MSNKPSIFKSKVSLQLDNEVVVALDRKASEDGTSRNAVANYLLRAALHGVIQRFNRIDVIAIQAIQKRNWEKLHAN